MSNLPLLNSRFPALILKRTLLATSSDKEPVVGDILHRNSKGLLEKYLPDAAGPKPQQPVAILLSEPETSGETSTAKVGFSGVYWSEAVRLEGFFSDTIAKLEQKGFHFMTSEGLEPAPLFELEQCPKASKAKNRQVTHQPQDKPKVALSNHQKARNLYMKDLKSFEAIASQLKLTLSTVKGYWIKDRETAQDWDLPTNFSS